MKFREFREAVSVVVNVFEECGNGEICVIDEDSFERLFSVLRGLALVGRFSWGLLKELGSCRLGVRVRGSDGIPVPRRLLERIVNYFDKSKVRLRLKKGKVIADVGVRSVVVPVVEFVRLRGVAVGKGKVGVTVDLFVKDFLMRKVRFKSAWCSVHGKMRDGYCVHVLLFRSLLRDCLPDLFVLDDYNVV